MILLLLLIICVVYGNLYDNCVFNLTDSRGIVAEYDLEWFNLAYEVFEVTDAMNKNYVYKFNICGKINTDLFTNNETIPNSCIETGEEHGPCIKEHVDSDGTITCVQREDVTGKVASAVQIDKATGSCQWIGMEVSSKDEMPEFSVELYDEDNAGKGIKYSILNGEWCPGPVSKNRELQITLICPDDNRIEFEPGKDGTQILTEEVDEYPPCTYSLVVESPLACPNKCVSRMNLEMFSVCATNGICVSDPEAEKVRCLCDDGYAGSICEEQENEIVVMDQTHPGLLAAIVICIVLLGVAIVLAAVLCHKIRMKEAEEASGTMHIGLTQDNNDAILTTTHKTAVSMEVGSGGGPGGNNNIISSVQLQTVDDQLETDNINNNDDDDDITTNQ
eukprot:433532_1